MYAKKRKQCSYVIVRSTHMLTQMTSGVRGSASSASPLLQLIAGLMPTLLYAVMRLINFLIYNELYRYHCEISIEYKATRKSEKKSQ